MFEDGVIDHTERLGFANMPHGYRLLQLDSGHFIFERERDEVESAIHWNKWVVRQWALRDARLVADTKPAEET